ncbi:hypothetical protein TGME49_257810 [Toxoplasma gondii ME49]|uniref:Uncharacterized protein n=2 Tax=Toxoplasma gondii TaxID=5811 RepID=A0A125YKC3_TOXGV|nr:hypothetical protein TGME49_257810 [Toxoplasma gondii ME49]EPT29297.1 hypothetical protein TGME49_257810 [Toxoplasma gondii ME49]ESS28247.1 hypothetical protein TGVEG_257810 [Toxoplasma gondii VEG]|eukprot:XP_018636991.1 hypothetical protein TGME49_257810 [Toxoplasma gondii ME49]
MLPCLPSSAAPPSSWALATSEQSELALSRFQMSRLRLKSVPTETSLESVLAHIATSDLLLGRIASLREAYPELESHILVEQAKTRILQGLKAAWSSLQLPMDCGSYRYRNMEEYFQPSDRCGFKDSITFSAGFVVRCVRIALTEVVASRFQEHPPCVVRGSGGFSGLKLDEGLLLDDVMAMIDKESGTVPGGSSPAHSVPSPPDEQHLLDELIPSLDPQDDTDQR